MAHHSYGPEGLDYETGHGLINCYRAVKEVLRRKAIRNGTDPAPYTGRSENDSLDTAEYRKTLADRRLIVGGVAAGSPASKGGLQRGDVILKVNGESVPSESVVRAMLQRAKSTAVTLTVRRQQKGIELEIKSGAKGLGPIFEQFRAPVFE